jgi:hypothetical protein
VRPGDRFLAGATGRLVEGEAGPGKVSARFEGVMLDGPATQSFDWVANRALRFDFPVSIPTPGYDAEGRLTRSDVVFRIGAERAADGAGDAVEVRLPLRDDRDRVVLTDAAELQPGTPWKLPEAAEAARAGSLRRKLLASSEPGILELASGLERLAFSDPLLSYTYVGQGGTTAPPSSALFGALVQGDGTLRTGAHDWSDTQAVPGVRLDTEMREQADVGAREATATAGFAYQRRWTVWDMVSPQPGAAGTTPGVKVIAVSVVWRDPPFDRPREVVLYTQVANPGSIIAGLASSP